MLDEGDLLAAMIMDIHESPPHRTVRRSGSLLTRGFTAFAVVAAVLLPWRLSLGPSQLSEDDAASRSPIPLNERLSFSSGGDALTTLGFGFGDPETDGVWVIASEAELRFSVPETVDQVEIEVYPFIRPDNETLALAVSTLEAVVRQELIAEPTIIRLPLSPSEFQSVRISCGSLESPMDLGLGSDQRPLCVKLISLRVLTAP